MNGQHTDMHLELSALYATGALPELERARFEAHLAEGCAVCEAELAALRPVIDALAAGVQPVSPSASLRERVLARAQAEGESASAAIAAAPPRRAALRWAAAASVLVALGLGAQVVSLRAQLSATNQRSEELARALVSEQQVVQQVRAELDETRAARTTLTAQVEKLEATTRVLTAPATRAVVLAGQGPAATARARAYLSPDTRTLILYAYDLPELPPDRTYQAWVIPGKTPVPIGVFAPESGGVARLEAPDVSGLEAPVTVAVTIEPQGGLPQPSGPIVLAGK